MIYTVKMLKLVTVVQELLLDLKIKQVKQLEGGYILKKHKITLKDWLRRNSNASTNDKMAAEQMLRDLKNALNGK